MRHGGYKSSDMGHSLVLNLTCDIEENKRQRHAALPFVKINVSYWRLHLYWAPGQGQQTEIILCFTQWNLKNA